MSYRMLRVWRVPVQHLRPPSEDAEDDATCLACSPTRSDSLTICAHRADAGSGLIGPAWSINQLLASLSARARLRARSRVSSSSWSMSAGQP